MTVQLGSDGAGEWVVMGSLSGLPDAAWLERFAAITAGDARGLASIQLHTDAKRFWFPVMSEAVGYRLGVRLHEAVERASGRTVSAPVLAAAS